MAKSNQGKITALYEGFPEMMNCKVNLTAILNQKKYLGRLRSQKRL